MLTVTSVNVNGLRAAAKKGFVEWLAGTSADVLCLQEVRAEPQQLPEERPAARGLARRARARRRQGARGRLPLHAA